jgi:hypothetical protein
LINNSDNNAGWPNATTLAFGDFISYKSGDVYNTIAIGGTSSGNGSNYYLSLLCTGMSNVNYGHYVARSYTQTGTSLNVGKHGNIMGSNQYIGAGGLNYPNPEDSMLYISEVFIHETNSLRGYLPGLWCPLHNRPLTHGDTYSGVGALAGKTFEACNLYIGAQIHFETSNTW